MNRLFVEVPNLWSVFSPSARKREAEYRALFPKNQERMEFMTESEYDYQNSLYSKFKVGELNNEAEMRDAISQLLDQGATIDSIVVGMLSKLRKVRLIDGRLTNEDIVTLTRENQPLFTPKAQAFFKRCINEEISTLNQYERHKRTLLSKLKIKDSAVSMAFGDLSITVNRFYIAKKLRREGFQVNRKDRLYHCTLMQCIESKVYYQTRYTLPWRSFVGVDTDSPSARLRYALASTVLHCLSILLKKDVIPVARLDSDSLSVVGKMLGGEGIELVASKYRDNSYRATIITECLVNIVRSYREPSDAQFMCINDNIISSNGKIIAFGPADHEVFHFPYDDVSVAVHSMEISYDFFFGQFSCFKTIDDETPFADLTFGTFTHSYTMVEYLCPTTVSSTNDLFNIRYLFSRNSRRHGRR